MAEIPDPVGRLEFEKIRSVFRDEARNFTTWMEQHVDVLAERLGIQLSVVQREKAVGDFSVDLLCEDESGRPIIIENQLGQTDHDHLGKLLTYLVNLDASGAIWVTPEPRQEHQKVVDWLNENTSADLSFYLVRVEAVRIGKSPVAPLFTVLAAPDRKTKEVGEGKKEWAERHEKRLEFWTGLLARSREKTPLFANISPSRYHWIGTGAGRSGVSFNYVVMKDWGSVELYIDHDHDTGAKNEAILDALLAQKADIERECGQELDWERLENRRACRIRKKFADGGLANPESWASLQEKMIDGMIRLDRALRSRLARVEV